MQPWGKMLLVLGIVIAGIGLALMFSDRFPLWGKLPGDIDIQRDKLRVIFPVTSSILISVVVSGILWLVFHFKGK